MVVTGWSAGAGVASTVVEVVVVVVVAAGEADVCARAEPMIPRARIDSAAYLCSAVKGPG